MYEDYSDYHHYTDYDNDYNFSIPEFPTLSPSQSNPKCCGPTELLAVEPGNKWTCQPDNYSVTELSNMMSNISDPKVFDIKLETVEMENICQDNDQVIWTPLQLDFRDNMDMSTHRFFTCLDGVRNGGEGEINPIAVGCEDLYPDIDLICKTGNIERIVFIFFGSISVISIIISLAVYMLIPKLRNIHGKVVICNLFSCLMFLIYLLIIYSSCWSSWPLPGSVSCLIMSYFGYFSTLAMVVWMSALATDLCWTLASTRIMTRQNTGKRLMSYNLVGWLLPSLLTTMAAFMDIYEVGIRPRFGEESCFLALSSHLVYLNIPISIFMVINLILYLITVIFIYQTTKNIRINISKDQRNFQQDLIIFTKMFLVMGILWLSEIFSTYIKSNIFSILLSILNLSRGTFMFVIFILKSSVLRDLRSKLCRSPSNQLGSQVLTEVTYRGTDGNSFRKISSGSRTSNKQTKKISSITVKSETDF